MRKEYHLTKEQEKLLAQYQADAKKCSLDTTPMNREKVGKIARRLCSILGDDPDMEFFEDPVLMRDAFQKRTGYYPSILMGRTEACHTGHFWFLHDHLEKLEEEYVVKLELIRETGWWIYERGLMLFSEPPCEVHLNEELDFHNVGGPAIRWKTGLTRCFYEGREIDARYGVPVEDWNPRWLLEEGNAEIRRMILREVGAERVLDGLDSDLVHSSKEVYVGAGGELFEDHLELHQIEGDVDVEPIRILLCSCPSSGRRYAIRVDPTTETCEEARRSTFPSLREDKKLQWGVET